MMYGLYGLQGLALKELRGWISFDTPPLKCAMNVVFIFIESLNEVTTRRKDIHPRGDSVRLLICFVASPVSFAYAAP